jgi:hypothetical protein
MDQLTAQFDNLVSHYRNVPAQVFDAFDREICRLSRADRLIASGRNGANAVRSDACHHKVPPSLQH